jgi:hypothetical protein
VLVAGLAGRAVQAAVNAEKADPAEDVPAATPNKSPLGKKAGLTS